MKNVIIQTHRLVLREFIPEDATHMFLLNSDEEVIRFTGDKSFNNVDEARTMIENYHQYEKYGHGRWTVSLDSSQEYLGWCGLSYNESSNETDLGFRFLRQHWGKGFATESALACIQYAFNDLGLIKVIGRAMKENPASIRVLQKAGMRFENEFEAHGEKCVQYCITQQKLNSL